YVTNKVLTIVLLFLLRCWISSSVIERAWNSRNTRSDCADLSFENFIRFGITASPTIKRARLCCRAHEGIRWLWNGRDGLINGRRNAWSRRWQRCSELGIRISSTLFASRQRRSEFRVWISHY